MRKLFYYMKGDYMASNKILKQKEATVNEITKKLDNSKTFLLLNYQGLTVSAGCSLANLLTTLIGSIIESAKR